VKTPCHGWHSPRKGLHWINVVDRLDRIWLWICVNASISLSVRNDGKNSNATSTPSATFHSNEQFL